LVVVQLDRIENFTYSGAGMQKVYENSKWTVGIKNYKPANDIVMIASLERHNKTDELFVLLEGECTLVWAEELNGELNFSAVVMKRGALYKIPQSLWHNTVTTPQTKMILIEDPSTGADNSDNYDLNEKQIAGLKKAVAEYS
jgi:hypothetical protein